MLTPCAPASVVLVLCATIFAAGCGYQSSKNGKAGRDEPSAKPQPTDTRTPTAPAPSDRLDALPVVIQTDFKSGAVADFPAFRNQFGTGEATRGSYRLALRSGESVRAPVEPSMAPSENGALIVASVRSASNLRGRAGVFCRGSDDGKTGYELTFDRSGRATLDRVLRGKRTLVAGFEAPIDGIVPADAPVPGALFCGGKDNAGVVGAAVGVQEITFFDDPDPLPVTAEENACFVVGGGAPAQAAFATFQLRAKR